MNQRIDEAQLYRKLWIQVLGWRTYESGRKDLYLYLGFAITDRMRIKCPPR